MRLLGDRFVPVELPSARRYRATFTTAAQGLRVPLRLTWNAVREGFGRSVAQFSGGGDFTVRGGGR